MRCAPLPGELPRVAEKLEVPGRPVRPSRHNGITAVLPLANCARAGGVGEAVGVRQALQVNHCRRLEAPAPGFRTHPHCAVGSSSKRAKGRGWQGQRTATVVGISNSSGDKRKLWVALFSNSPHKRSLNPSWRARVPPTLSRD